jgi:hypothetical protein
MLIGVRINGYENVNIFMCARENNVIRINWFNFLPTKCTQFFRRERKYKYRVCVCLCGVLTV